MREHRIFGPPGSGKTTHLSRQIERAIRTYGSEGVLVSSFTRAAAAELLQRGLPLPRERIGTLHSFCFRTLGAPKVAELSPLIHEWNKSAKAEWRVDPHKAATIDMIDEPDAGSGDTGKEGRTSRLAFRLRNLLEPLDGWPEDCKQFQREWSEWKKEADLVDFTELVELANKAEVPPPGHAQVYFVDEAQDHTPLELAVVRRWGIKMRHWVLAGDDHQAIYGFRGASPQAFLSPELPGEQVTILDQTHRLPRKIKELAYGYLDGLSGPHVHKEFEPAREGGVTVTDKRLNYRSGYDVVKEVQNALQRDETVMVLASCGYMLYPVIAELRDAGVPFHNPYRSHQGLWNPMRGGTRRLLSFLKPREEWVWADVWPWFECLHMDAVGAKRGAKARVEQIAKDEEFGKVRVTSAEWREMTGIEIPEPDTKWLESHLLGRPDRTGTPRKGSPAAKFEYALNLVRKNGSVDVLTQEPKVVVGTIHSVKGAEADTVILFPDTAPLHQDEFDRVEGRDSVIRMFYVGMTRARKRLVMTMPARRGRNSGMTAGSGNAHQKKGAACVTLPLGEDILIDTP